MLDVSVESLVPSSLLGNWKSLPPAKEEEVLSLPAGYSLREIQAMLDFRTVELSGGLGSTWITVGAGTKLSAQCRRDYIFSWHTHPDGECRFSSEDWISFITSEALMTLLFTADTVCFYKKHHNANWYEIKEKFNTETQGAKYRPHLRIVRFMKLIERKTGLRDWTLCSEYEISNALGMEYEKAIVK
jgi:hypothetical protein